MAKKQKARSATPLDAQLTPMVAATLAGVIYQARLLNRQSKLNIPEEEVVLEVVSLWRAVKDALSQD
jgi:hypothetical protein